jgi:hypothetical protein
MEYGNNHTFLFESILLSKRYCLLITHFELKDLDLYGLKQTILRVNSIPPVTCFGKGFTKTDAKNASALQAIEHFVSTVIGFVDRIHIFIIVKFNNYQSPKCVRIDR